MAGGPKSLATAELIAILLGTGQGQGKLSAVGLGQYIFKSVEFAFPRSSGCAAQYWRSGVDADSRDWSGEGDFDFGCGGVGEAGVSVAAAGNGCG